MILSAEQCHFTQIRQIYCRCLRPWSLSLTSGLSSYLSWYALSLDAVCGHQCSIPKLFMSRGAPGDCKVSLNGAYINK